MTDVTAAPPHPERLEAFIATVTRLLDVGIAPQAALRAEVADALAGLVAVDDWLAPALAIPDPSAYRQYLIHCDARERFSVISFVWGPGQRTPVHNHTVWGVIGVLRGAEISTGYRRGTDGVWQRDAACRLDAGAIAIVSPETGDVHEVANAHDDMTSVSIHVYGGNIGAITRCVFDVALGTERPFVSGYSKTPGDVRAGT